MEHLIGDVEILIGDISEQSLGLEIHPGKIKDRLNDPEMQVAAARPKQEKWLKLKMLSQTISIPLIPKAH